MTQIKNIFTFGLNAMHHKRALSQRGRNVGSNPFFELRMENDRTPREKLLRSFLPREHLSERINEGITALAGKNWRQMDANEKQKAILYFVSLKKVDGIVVKVKPKPRFPMSWGSIGIYVPATNGKFLGIKINLDISNSGAFEIKILEGRLRWRADMVDWRDLSGSEYIPVWNTQEWGDIQNHNNQNIDPNIPWHSEEQKENWEFVMDSIKPQFFVAQKIESAEEEEPRELLVGFISRNSFSTDREFSTLNLNANPFEGSEVGRSSYFLANTLPPNTTNKTIDDITNALARGEPNLLLYGPPGTGKTYLCQEIRNSMKQNSRNLFIDEDSAEMRFGLPNAKTWWVTFHQSVTYEDFVLGLRPKVGEGGGMELVPRAGPLLEAMEYAKENNGKNHSVIFIDEINRGDLSRILGDFITYMDVDKRGVIRDDEVAEGDKTLPLRFALLDPNKDNRNSSEKILINGEELNDGINLTDGNYIVPPNLTIIATMNSLDRSVAPMDSAMKRRFFQINILPDADVVKKMMEANGAPEWLIYLTQHLMNRLNDWLRRVFNNDDIQIGHSYFAKVSSIDDLVDAWERRILPLLLDLCRSTTKRDELERLLQWREDDTSWNNAMEYAENQGLSVLSQTRTWPYKSNQLIRSGEVASIEGGDMRLSFFYLICKQKGDDSTTWEEEYFRKYLESRHAPDEGLVGDLDADPAQFEVFNEARGGSSRSNRNVLFDVVGGGAQIVINEGTVISAEADITAGSMNTVRNQELVEFIRAEIGDNYEVQDGDENWSLTAPITIDLPHAGEHGVRAFGHAFFALMNYSPGSQPHRLRVRRQPDDIENNRGQTEMKRIDAFDFWN